MQQYDNYFGFKSRSDSRTGTQKSSDFWNKSDKKRGPRLSRHRKFPNTQPDTYMYSNVEDKSYYDNRYRSVYSEQDKSLSDGYRNIQSTSSPDRYRNVPDSSRKVPDKALSGSSRKMPVMSSPDSSRKVPDKSLSDSLRKVPDKSVPDSHRKLPDKSFPDSSKKVPDKLLPDSSRKVLDKSLPDSRKVPDKSLPDSSSKVPDKSLSDSSRKVPDKSLPDSRKVPDRYRNDLGNKTGKMRDSFQPIQSSHQEGNSRFGSATSCEFPFRSGGVRSPIMMAPVNVQPMPMTFMLRFPPPHFVRFHPPVTSYQSAGITNDTFCDFDQYSSNLPQPSWENYDEMDESSYGFNYELDTFHSSHSHWSDDTVDQPTALSGTSHVNQMTHYPIEYSDAYEDIQYNSGFHTEPPVGECSAGHNTIEYYKGYSGHSVHTCGQAIEPQYSSSMTEASQTTVVPTTVPRGTVSGNISSFLPHCVQTKTAACQSEQLLQDASTNTDKSCVYVTTGTNTESDFMISVGSNTEAAELIAVSTCTDQVEMRTVATNTELTDVHKKETRMVATNTEMSDVFPASEMPDPSEVMHKLESWTNFGGAKPRMRPDSMLYTYSRSNEDETIGCHNISGNSSSKHASFDAMPNPEYARHRNIQKDSNQRRDICSGKLPSADLEEIKKPKRNLASKSDLDEVYYSDESAASEADEMMKERRVSNDTHQPDDRDQFSLRGRPDFFPKWAVVGGTGSTSPLSAANTVFKAPLSPDLTNLRDSPVGNLKLPHTTNLLAGLSLLQRTESQRYFSAASSACSVASGLTSAAPSLCPSLPLSPEWFPASAGDASFVNTVLIENSDLTKQIMMMLLKVNPLFALDHPAHRLATFKELMLVKRCQFEMKLSPQRHEVSEDRPQQETSRDSPKRPDNESTFGKLPVKEQTLSMSQLDQCVQQAGYNSANVPQRQHNLERLEGWPMQYLDQGQLLQKQPQQHIQPRQHEINASVDDLPANAESYLKRENERIFNVSQNHPWENMEEKPFRQLRHQRKLVGSKEGGSNWRDRFARQKAAEGCRPQTPNTSEIQEEEHNSEKISELSEITVEDVATKTQQCSDEETWQKVCRKKKTVRTLKESGPKKFSRRK